MTPPHAYPVTEGVSEVTTTGARLSGTVNPEGLETKYYFEYGPTIFYGKTTPEVSAGSSRNDQAVSQTITGLVSYDKYHYRLVASNSTGVNHGTDHSFVTEPNFKIAVTPNPSGALASELSSTSCPSSASCVAVGRYENSSGVWVTLAESWNGTEWHAETPPNPTGTKESVLKSVSCTSSTACIAVGEYIGTEGEVALGERWNGIEWSLQSVPEDHRLRSSLLEWSFLLVVNVLHCGRSLHIW